jgi:hypothetical protein
LFILIGCFRFSVSFSFAGQHPTGLNASHIRSPLMSGIYHLVPRNWLREWRKYLKDSHSISTAPSGDDSLSPLDCGLLFCNAHGSLVIPPHVEEYLLGMKRSLFGGSSGLLHRGGGNVHNSGRGSEIEVEIITVDEWEELQRLLTTSSYNDLYVRFLIDNDTIGAVEGGKTDNVRSSNAAIEEEILYDHEGWPIFIPSTFHTDTSSSSSSSSSSIDSSFIQWNCPCCSICDPYNYTPLRLTDKASKKKEIKAKFDDFIFPSR